VKKIYSNIDPLKLLHLINRLEEIDERTDVAPENQFIQLATLKHDKGKTFRAHQHIWKNGSKNVIAQESWVVIQGSVRVFFYDTDGTLIDTDVIGRGDCSMTFEGGHNYEILEDNTIVYEYKTGPYTGVENDKVFIT
jgi:cupin fold WbuC family metalloprotein